MKKHNILFQLVIAACAGMLFHGCQKEEPYGLLTLKAVVSDDYGHPAGSKTHIIDKCVYWDNGDFVNINGTRFDLSVATNESVTTATIDSVPVNTQGYVAVYPAGFVTTPGDVTPNSTSVGITIPSILYMKPGHTQNTQGLMVATMAYSGTSLSFHNASSVLALDVTNGFTNEAELKLYRIVVKSSTSGLSGAGTLTIDGSAPSYTITGSDFLTLDMEDDTILHNATKTYYIPIPPQEQDGGTQFTIIIYATCDDNHYKFTRNSQSGLTVQRNKQVSVPVELNATNQDYTINTINGGSGLMGSGTEADPYVIATLTDLEYFRSQVSGGNTYTGKYIRQTTDINTGEEVWTGPGAMSGSNYTVYFSGIYDGGNHSIRLNLKAENYNGFFKYMYKGTIKNLKLYGTALSTDKSDFGAFCGITIDQTSTEGASVDATAKSTFYNCENHISLTGTSNIGGIVGHAKSPIEIENCKNYGIITASSSSNATLGAGGIIGKAEYSVTTKTTSTSILTVKGCENHASVTATTSHSTKALSAGGCIGLMTCIGSITDCINDASVSGDCNVGGIIGKSGTTLNYEITITGCNNIGSGEIKIKASVAGTSNSGLGGIIGYSNKAITMKKCLNTMVVENTGSGTGLYVGGLIGLIPADIKEMSDCGNRGYINSKKSFAVAGLANGKGAMTVVNSYNTGDVNFQVSGGSRKAGFVTFNNTTDAKITLTNCYFSGNLTGQTTSYDCDMISENKKNSSSKTTNCYSKTKTNVNTSYGISANYLITLTNGEYKTNNGSSYLKDALNSGRTAYDEWKTTQTGANQYKELPHLAWEDE